MSTHSEHTDSVPLCFFTDSLEPSGVGVHLLNLMRWLDPARYRLSLVCPDTTGCQQLMAQAASLGVVVHPLTVRDRQDRASADRLRHILQSEGTAIFHSQVGISWEGLLGLRIAHEAGAVRQALGLRPGAPLLLTVARLTAQKGHDVLLAAVPRILAHHPNACFAWVGQGPEQEKLAAEVQALGLAGNVRFLGPRDDVPALLGAADLFVLPSRFEGHPLAALEALASGLPVVGTRVCGLDEAVLPGETGLLVEPERPDELADAVHELLAHPGLRRRMGQAGRRLIAERFSARRMAQQTMQLYEQLLRESQN
jgi:glycosyltransferase involved in cell wall biosynthesis